MPGRQGVEGEAGRQVVEVGLPRLEEVLVLPAVVVERPVEVRDRRAVEAAGNHGSQTKTAWPVLALK